MINFLLQTLPTTFPDAIPDANHLLIKDVQEFYENSWSHLLWIIGPLFIILTIIVSVVMPIVLNTIISRHRKEDEKIASERSAAALQHLNDKNEMRYERQQTKYNDDIKALRAEIEEKVAALQKAITAESATALQNIQTEIKAELSEDMKKVREELQISTAENTARDYHAQGVRNFSNHDYKQATNDFSYASSYYLDAKDEGNAQKALKLITVCLSNLHDTQYEEIETEQSNISISILIKKLESKNVNGRYTNFIRELKTESKAASTRPRPATA